MPNPGRRLDHFATPFVRSLAALGFVIVFFVTASVFEPGPSPAYTGGSARPALVVDAPASLGSLVGPTYSTYILDTPDGPRYTVYDQHGSILIHAATAEEVYRAVPDYNILDLTAAMSEVGESDIDPEF